MVGVGSSSSMSWFFSEREWPPLTTHGDLIPPPRLSHLLNNRFGRFVHCSIKKFAHLRHAPRMKDVWCRGLYQSKGIGILQLSSNAFVSPYSSFFGFFNRGETRKDLGNERTSNFGTSGRGRDSISGGQWTDVLLAANVLIFIAQIASRGKLFLWAAKINNLIEKGQVWRLVTSSFLHVDLWHLMINCYSLSNVGPSIERISGPRRFLAVYFTSAIAGTAMSYWFNKMPSVGASGAIFGMVGSLAVFHMRHRGMFGDGEKDLQNIVKVIIVNMAIGLVVQRIDNWGHLGGLLGGAAASWFLGPAWKYVYLSHDGQRYVVDTAPIWSLLGKKRNLGS